MSEEHLCIVCPALHPNGDPHHPNTMPVCDGCRARVHRDLTGLPAAYAALPAMLRAGRVNDGRGAAFGSRLPVNLGALDLLGPGSATLTAIGWAELQIGHLPPLTLLETWAANWIDVRDMGEHQPNATVAELAGWLLVRLEWAMDHHPAVDEFAADIAAVTRSVWVVSQYGRPKGESAGRCPTATRDGPRCNTRLTVDPYVDQISCGKCGSTWDRRKGEWLKLRGQQIGMVAA
jgi:hypothetical protein